MENSPNLVPNLDDIVIKRRSSLFVASATDAAEDAASASASTSHKLRYAEQLKSELQSWRQLISLKKTEIVEHSQNRIRLDESVLSEEQRLYLGRGPQVDSYVKGSEEFCQLLERYIQRKSFLAQRYDVILAEARAQMDTKALELAEQKLVQGDGL